MVQQYQSPVRVYKYPFELVMAAYERRFPTCPMIPIFLGSDTISEYKSPDGAVHMIERRCRLNVDAPYLLKKIIGVDYVLFIQKNTLDLRKRTLKIEARNESFASRVAIDELCTYYVHPENSNWTCFEQSGTLDVKSFFGFESSIEKLAVKQYSQNIAKGKEIIEHFVAQLREEGITHVSIYQESDSPSFDEENGNQLSDVTSEDSRERSCSQDSSNSSEDLQLGATALTLQHALEKLTLHDGQYQLDSDYIQRYVGNLSPLQESRLVQLRKCVAELHRGKVPSDTTLLRFLRARNFHLEKAREMLCQSLVWRKKHQVDKLLAEYELPLVVKDYFPGSWHFTDIDGRPLFLLRVGHMDVKGLVKSIGEEGLLKLTLHFCEEGLRLCEEATTASGKPVSTWTLLVDLDGLNMRHLWRPGIQTLLRIIEVMEANYPDTLSRILITRAPRVFPVLWTVVSTFIDEVTRSKILFHAGTDWHVPGGLADYIHPERIPDFLGGPCQTNLSEGGLIPKSFYMTEEEHFDRERTDSPSLCENAIYRCVTLGKGQVHEVVIQNEDIGSVLCWDFDVMKQDVAFTVLRTRNPVPKAAAGSTEIVLAMESVIDKSWKVGVDYFVEEETLVSQDGESVQGSHVTMEAGTYILQWRVNDSPHTMHRIDLIDSLTGLKAKIMYFYEILSSDHYRGSMSSLQSAHSGFSSLSQQTLSDQSIASR